MQEVLYDVELVIHVKTDDETSNDILENIQNFVSLGRSEDFIELIEAKETEICSPKSRVHLKMTIKFIQIYQKLQKKEILESFLLRMVTTLEKQKEQYII